MPSVFLTGAGRGIGRTTAVHLAAAGWEVYAGVRNLEDGEVLAATAATGRIIPVVLDVTDAAQIAALDQTLPERIHALVNNAGIVIGGPVEGLAIDDLRHQ